MRFSAAFKINGLVAAAFAAYHSDGSVNLDYIPKITEHLITQGIKGIFVCGTNGEGLSLTMQERKEIAQQFVNSAGDKVKIIVHVGHSSIEQAKELARHAQEIGANAISSVCAFYFKPANEDVLLTSLVEIANSAPRLPFYYYHIPHITGVQINLDTFIPKLGKLLPSFAGIKFTSSAIHEYQDGLQICADEYDMLYGFDELLLPALAVGAKGAIGSTYNYAAPIYLKVIELFSQGKHQDAQELHYQAIKMIKLIVKYSPIPAQRAIMEMIGFQMGHSRLPLQTLSEGEWKALKTELDGAGFFKTLKICTESLTKTS